MLGEPVDDLTGFEVPDHYSVVLGPRDDASPIRAHRHGIHPTLMPGEPVDWLTRFQVPDHHGVVSIPRPCVGRQG